MAAAEFQNPTGAKPETQTEIAGIAEDATPAGVKAKQPKWPAKLPEQVAAVRAIVQRGDARRRLRPAPRSSRRATTRVDPQVTALLERAFAIASRLPAPEQDALAAIILAEIAAYSDSAAAALEHLADEAIAEHHAGRTRPI